MAKEIYHKYFASYKETMCGWYFVWEIDNLMVQNKQALQVLETAFNRQLEFLTKLDSELFFIFSPYMNSWLATKEEYRDFWIELFAKVNFREGDVFSPMDCVGAGGTSLDNVASWFAEFRKAVDTKPGLRFWSNAENFDHKDWSSAPINRFIKQLELVAGYVDDFITFAYPHYYSPNIIDHGFHRTYLEYVKTGKIAKLPLSPPTELQTVEMPDGSFFLMWDRTDENIAGYLIHRDGKEIAKTQVPRINNPGYVNAYQEKNLEPDKTYKYVLYAYDFAGNISLPSKEFLVRF